MIWDILILVMVMSFIGFFCSTACGLSTLGAVVAALGILILCITCFFGGILAVTDNLTNLRFTDDADNSTYIVLKLGKFEYRMKVKEERQTP